MSSPPMQPESARQTYPAMLPAEIAVWRAWLQLHQGEYDRFDYNTRVGPGYDPGGGVPQYIRDMSIANTKKRIDAVAWKGSQPLIVEVKVRAGLSAIGQLLGYITHWRLENPHSPPPQSLLVASALAPGVQEVLDKYSLTAELVTVQQ
jgi:hypothetical protein